MKSYNIPQVLNAMNKSVAMPRKQWVKPSVEIIALESAEIGSHINSVDGHGGNYIHPRS